MSNTVRDSDSLSQRTDALVNRIDQATEALLGRFASIIEFVSNNSSEEIKQDMSTAAATALLVENQANEMVRAAEDLRVIIREVREHWILGEQSQQLTSSQNPNETDVEISEIQLRDILVRQGTAASVI